MTKSPLSSQARTTLGARLKIRIVALQQQCFREAQEAHQKATEAAKDLREGEPPPKTPNPLELFSDKLSSILEEELGAQPNTVDRLVQMESVVQTLSQLVGRTEMLRQEGLLHRELLGMVLEQGIRGTIEQTDIRRAAAREVGVGLSSIEVVRP